VQIRPVVGIAMETLRSGPVHTSAGWVVEQRYVQVLSALGGVPWIIPLLQGDEETLKAIYSHLDGVLLTGGVDIDPTYYHDERHALCGPTDPPRDWAEVQLIRWAIRDHLPILGVCRGLQMMNVALGGTLYQDVPSEIPGSIQHDRAEANGSGSRVPLMHQLRIEPRSRLANILGTDQIGVNSTHHQAIKELASGLMRSAWAADGVIEAIEGNGDQNHYLVGVQWHPEDLTDTMVEMRQLFRSFLDAARTYRQGRTRRSASQAQSPPPTLPT
jgi:putative glutamine amidotransferase